MTNDWRARYWRNPRMGGPGAWVRHGRRRLFWRFYVTLLASLMAMVLVGGFIWHMVAEGPFPPGYDLEKRLSEALLPPPLAPKAQTDAAVAALAKTLKAQVALLSADGRLISTNRWGDGPHDGAPDDDERERMDLHMPRGQSFRAWRVDLADGRILIARGLHLSPDIAPGFYYLFIIAIGIGAVAFPFVRRITRRLEELRHAVETWGDGHLDIRMPERGNDEIAAVARSFNTAAGRIQALIAAHRTLLANASHELRSPLARLRMAIEVFQSTPSDALQRSIEEDISELDQLVDEILLASRLEHAGSEEPRENVDLLGLAAEEAARVDAALETTADASALIVRGSTRLLRRLIRNLLENARRHGAPPIRVALGSSSMTDQASKQRIRLTVTDSGQGIPATERTRIFEPFYRPVGHAEASGSWGLGLALVARIAANHNGSVRCEEAPTGGAMFVVELPSA